MLDWLKNKPKQDSQEVMESSDMYPPMPENSVELHAQMIELKASDVFSHINKDMILARLDNREKFAVRKMCEIIGFAEFYHLEELKKLYLHDLFVLLATSRSSGGWQQETMATAILKTSKSREVEKNKRWGLS